MNRYQEGLFAYCKYCYEVHGKWDNPDDYEVWECGKCGSSTRDEFMQIENGVVADGEYAYLTLNYPPSANRYWRNFKGHMVVSDEATYYKKNVGWVARIAGVNPQMGEVKLYLDLYRPQKSGDLDNRIKVLCDALNGVAYEDDSQIIEIHARRFDDKANPRVVVRIEAVNS